MCLLCYQQLSTTCIDTNVWRSLYRIYVLACLPVPQIYPIPNIYNNRACVHTARSEHDTQQIKHQTPYPYEGRRDLINVRFSLC
jgi:hypothetical protein